MLTKSGEQTVNNRPISFDTTTQGLLYLQLENELKHAILDGQYAVGEQIPTEQELCEHFGVSRITVRRAIQDLFEEGLLEKVRGRGTFVAVPKHVLSATPAERRGFTDLASDGKKTVKRILEKSCEVAGDELSNFLGVKKGEEVYFVRRLISIEDFPMAIDNLFVPKGRFPELLDLLGEGDSFYELITSHYDFVFGVENLTIDASTARGDECTLLKYPTGSPLFILRKVMSSLEGIPLHYSKTIVRADRISYHFVVDKDGRVMNKGDEFTLASSDLVSN